MFEWKFHPNIKNYNKFKLVLEVLDLPETWLVAFLSRALNTAPEDSILQIVEELKKFPPEMLEKYRLSKFTSQDSEVIKEAINELKLKRESVNDSEIFYANIKLLLSEMCVWPKEGLWPTNSFRASWQALTDIDQYLQLENNKDSQKTFDFIAALETLKKRLETKNAELKKTIECLPPAVESEEEYDMDHIGTETGTTYTGTVRNPEIDQYSSWIYPVQRCMSVIENKLEYYRNLAVNLSTKNKA